MSMAMNQRGAPMTTVGNLWLTPNASAHTVGAWSEAVASLPVDMCGVHVYLHGEGSNVFWVDIGVGSSGNEVVRVHGLGGNSDQYRTAGGGVFIPLAFKRGDRVTARTQNEAAGQNAVNIRVRLNFVPQTPDMPAGAKYCTTVGINDASTRGTYCPNSFGVGTWTELVASLAADVSAFIIVPITDSGNSTSDLSIGTGAASAEFVVAANILYQCGYSNNSDVQLKGPFFVGLPKGARVSLLRAGNGMVYTAYFHLLLFH